MPGAHGANGAWRNGDFEISTDAARIDVATLHGFLAESYWAHGIPRHTVEQAIRNSLCFGIYRGKQQAGFARVITDRATFAYLADVFVLPEFRGRGLSKWLMECIVTHPDLQGLRRWSLVTRDAHALYQKFGFRALATPDQWMEKHDPGIYARKRSGSVP